jgi:type II secretory pathway pseudopilin PulG
MPKLRHTHNRPLRVKAFTMLELVTGLIVTGILFSVLSIVVRGVLIDARQSPVKQTLTAFIGAQQSRYDVVGAWLPAGSTTIVDVTIVDSTTASTNARTVSMATDTNSGYARIAGAVLDANGDCLIWRAFESGAPNADVKLVVTGSACTGATALTATTGVSW